MRELREGKEIRQSVETHTGARKKSPREWGPKESKEEKRGSQTCSTSDRAGCPVKEGQGDAASQLKSAGLFQLRLRAPP